MLLKNISSQGVYLFAYDTANNQAETGDAANITGDVSKDGGSASATATAHPTEIGGGIYWQPLSQAETNANAIALYWASSTTGVRIDPVLVLTTGVSLPVAAPAASGGLVTVGTGSGQVNAAGGKVPATVATADVTGNLPADVQTIKAQTVTASAGVTFPASIGTSTYAGGAVASVTGAVGSVTGAVGSVTSPVSITSNVKKNQALNAYEFAMTDSTTHAPKTGLGSGVTATRSLDGGSFAACANAVAEVANGTYKIDLATTDMNANTITFRFTATGADDLLTSIITQP